MFRFLRRKNMQGIPLYCKIAEELKASHNPIPRIRLVQLLGGEYGDDTVERELDRMVDTWLLDEHGMYWGDGQEAYYLQCVGFPGQYERSLGLAA
jgi:hypothetical protein